MRKKKRDGRKRTEEQEGKIKEQAGMEGEGEGNSTVKGEKKSTRREGWCGERLVTLRERKSGKGR